jgi:hypothetical protein
LTSRRPSRLNLKISRPLQDENHPEAPRIPGGEAAYTSVLPVGEHALDSLYVGGVKDLSKPERPLTLGGLLGQNVAAVGLVEFDFAGTGHFKALCSGSACFDFGHGKNLFSFKWNDERRSLSSINMQAHRWYTDAVCADYTPR